MIALGIGAAAVGGAVIGLLIALNLVGKAVSEAVGRGLNW